MAVAGAGGGGAHVLCARARAQMAAIAALTVKRNLLTESARALSDDRVAALDAELAVVEPLAAGARAARAAVEGAADRDRSELERVREEAGALGALTAALAGEGTVRDTDARGRLVILLRFDGADVPAHSLAVQFAPRGPRGALVPTAAEVRSRARSHAGAPSRAGHT